MWRKPTPSLHKYNQNFKLNNCAISKIPKTSHIFKPLLAVRFFIYFNFRFSFCAVLKSETHFKIKYYVFKTHKIR